MYHQRSHIAHLTILLAPALLLFGFVVVVPVVQGSIVAFTNWDGIAPQFDFIGLRNFRFVLTDPDLVLPIRNTLLFSLLTVVQINVVGVFLAVGVYGAGRLGSAVRSVLLLPMVISLVLAAFIWSYIFADVLPVLFGIRGLLGNRDTVILGLAAIAIWRDTGLATLIYFAGLNAIPRQLYEAAAIDGAGPFVQFRRITVPLLAPAVTVCVTLWLGWGLRVFDYPMAATGGGPGRASETVAMYVYNYTFPFARAGYGQAAAVLMFVCIFFVSGTAARLLRRREHTL